MMPRRVLSAAFQRLRVPPARLHLVERRVHDVAVFGDQRILDVAEASLEFGVGPPERGLRIDLEMRSEEHTSELQSLMRISYAVFCLKKKTETTITKTYTPTD